MVTLNYLKHPCHNNNIVWYCVMLFLFFQFCKVYLEYDPLYHFMALHFMPNIYKKEEFFSNDLENVPKGSYGTRVVACISSLLIFKHPWSTMTSKVSEPTFQTSKSLQIKNFM